MARERASAKTFAPAFVIALIRRLAGFRRWRTFASLLVALACARSATAQSLSIGVKDGVVFRARWAEGSEVSQTTSIAGLVVAARLGPRFGLQTEALYTPERRSGYNGVLRTRLDERMVKIPVFARAYMPLPPKRILPVAYAGPWVGFRIGCTHHDVRGNELSCEGHESSLRLGAAWGGGLEIAVGPADILLDLRGEISASKVPPPAQSFDPAMHENAVMASLGVSFPLGNRNVGDWQESIAPTRLAREPRGPEPLSPGDRVRVAMLYQTTQGVVRVIASDSLVIDTPDPGFSGQLTVFPGMVKRVDVSLGRGSPVAATMIGAAAGAAVVLLFIGTRNLSYHPHDPATRPYVLAAPIAGALIGNGIGRERWKQAAFPDKRSEER
jgi:hypothetical protein